MTFSVECRPLSCSKLQVHVSGPGGTCQVELGRLLVVVSLCVRLWPFHGRLSLWLPLFVALVFEFSGVLFYTRLHPLLGRHPGQLPSPPWVGERGTHSGGYGPHLSLLDHGPNPMSTLLSKLWQLGGKYFLDGQRNYDMCSPQWPAQCNLWRRRCTLSDARVLERWQP